MEINYYNTLLLDGKVGVCMLFRLGVGKSGAKLQNKTGKAPSIVRAIFVALLVNLDLAS